MRVKITLNYLVIVMLIITCLVVQPVFAIQNTAIGTAPVTQTNFLARASAYPVTPHSIVPEIIEIGKISASINALGTTGSSGTLTIVKPAGATVRSAYLFAATTGFSGYKLANGDIKIDGTPVTWDIADFPNSISSYNYMGDVTSIVKSTIDIAPAGDVDFTISEANTGAIDGEILAVIFDDPAQTTDNTVVLLFGAQNVAGDDFNIGLAQPIDTSDPNIELDFSLGISFSYQNQQPPQFSLVDISTNTLAPQRMTTWAGGNDDGADANGALITVGGVGDSTANPADPYLSPVNDRRYDDELYSLLPFVADGDTLIKVHTQNPSDDDNVFFAALELRSATAVVGKGIILSPASATNPLNTQHTLTAKGQDATGAPIIGQEVTFTITAGPNKGVTGSGITDNNGEATFSYTGTTAGTDTIIASFVDTTGTISSNEATKRWVGEGPIPTPEFPSIFLPVTMIIGFLGAVLLIHRTREY